MVTLLNNGIARTLINNIPLNIKGNGITPASDAIAKVVENVPAVRHRVDFNSDVWDFSPYFSLVNSYYHIFNFLNYPEQIRSALKEYAAVRLDRPNSGTKAKVRTVYAILSSLSKTFGDLLKETDGIFEDIRSEHITAYVTAGNKGRTLNHVIDFLETVSALGYVHFIDLTELRALQRRCRQQSKFIKTQITGDIPEPLYNEIISNMNRVMRDETKTLNERLAAGMILIESQTGLRHSELCALKKDCLHWLKCSDGIERPYIEYHSMKEANDHIEAFLVQTICTPLLLRTIEYYLPLREKGAYARQSDFMLVFDYIPGVTPSAPKPETTYRMDSWRRRLMARYCPLTLERWPGLRYGYHPKLKDVRLTLPTMKNFRVHFAVSLYQKGMPLDYIEAIMSHTFSSDTYDNYYGTIKPKQETVELASEPFQNLFPTDIDF